MKKIKIISIENGLAEEAIDFVAEEQTINIFVNGTLKNSLQCSPTDQEKLVYGYLFSERLIGSASDVKRLYFETRMSVKNFYVETERKSENGIMSGRDIKVNANSLLWLMHLLFKNSVLFNKTGCAHISGLSDGKNVFSVFEDISRHSAIQKTIGDALLSKTLGELPVLLTSARVNETIVRYAKRSGIKIIASHSAPTFRAVEKARLSKITLIGFLRESRMNIYTVPERIVF